MHWFTDKEAWGIYRLAAVFEFIGWSLLIGAIIYRRFDMPFDDAAVTIAGRMHGVFFLTYFLVVFATFRSMGWGWWRLLGALAAGVPPFTALIFEKIMKYHRKKYPKKVTPPKGFDE